MLTQGNKCLPGQNSFADPAAARRPDKNFYATIKRKKILVPAASFFSPSGGGTRE
jgi:hypothetical protein